ncbi:MULTISPECIES: STAS domain-containing protein [Thermomonosporaceae]|uniref:STAS domain-containing protein n=1 Tax=Thermomonosporaceae TaxID=2012 RepID=UPI00255AC679|nr:MULTISPECIES: STAS domain-containing protein [Thermomonosporaceae]MDL4777808.1 STAS domain-containing protein [Actinomadura xylanilytica]
MRLGGASIEDTSAVVAFPAEVDIGNADLVLDQALQHLDNGAPGLVLDLTTCEFCDSSALATIDRAQMRATALGVPMWVVLPARGLVRRVCDAAGLARRVAIAPDLATARAALARPRRHAG